jgi:hypothetical protein
MSTAERNIFREKALRGRDQTVSNIITIAPVWATTILGVVSSSLLVAVIMVFTFKVDTSRSMRGVWLRYQSPQASKVVVGGPNNVGLFQILVPEKEVSMVHLGGDAIVELDRMTGTRLPAKVVNIAPGIATADDMGRLGASQGVELGAFVVVSLDVYCQTTVAIDSGYGVATFTTPKTSLARLILGTRKSNQ